MRNSKAKKLIGRKLEIEQRRTSRGRDIIEHKSRTYFTGRLNMDGTPETVKVPMVQLLNSYSTYKHSKALSKGN